MKRFFVLAACGAALSAGFIFAPQPAHASWMHFFFPMMPEQGAPDPGKTLEAPFADKPTEGPQLATVPGGKGLPENNTPLDFAHRNSQQVGEWVMGAASDAMTFDKPDSHAQLDEITKRFDDTGKSQFIQFLTDNGIMRVLDSNQYFVRGIVQETPLLLNEGAVNGRYHWLYEVPMMVSYMERSAVNYKKSDAKPVNQMMDLTIQVGRTADLTPGKDIIIERWSGKAQKITKE